MNWLFSIYKILLILCQFAILHALGSQILALHLLPLLILRVRALVEYNLRVTLKREDMCSNTVQEPTVVRDNHSTTCEVLQTLLQCSQSIYIDIIGRLIQKQHIALLLQCQGQVQAVTLTTRQHTALLLLIGTAEVKASHISTRRNLTVTQRNKV